MALAAERDLIARQYANGFHEVLHDGVPALHRGLEQTQCLEDAIIYAHLHLLAAYPDSLIAPQAWPGRNCRSQPPSPSRTTKRLAEGR